MASFIALFSLQKKKKVVSKAHFQLKRQHLEKRGENNDNKEKDRTDSASDEKGRVRALK